MRVISQNGMADLPYEKIIVCRDYTDVFCRFFHHEHRKIFLGGYSTQEKAQKVMEMLRKEWIIHGNKALFQFPKDEEVECK